MSATVSYDVFDTVVTRAFAHPRDLYVHLGTKLGVPDALEFARIRWTVERDARKKLPIAEITFAGIYAELARQLAWDEATARAAQTLELEIEARHLHAVPLMREELFAARGEASRLIFLSDMYLPSAVLRAWLEREGIAATGDVLLVSGEENASKSSGALFHAARTAHGGDFAHWRHAGDHPFADVAKPRELGIAATHHTHGHLTPREWAARGTRAEFASVWRSLLAGAMRLARVERVFGSERDAVLWETGATVAGPLFYAFVRWTLAEAARRGVKRLYFLARDGQIFLRVAQAIQAAEPGVVECRYLHASRLLFAGPAELESPAALRLLAAPTGQFHSRRQTLLQLGLDETDWPTLFRTGDPDANLPPAEREALADWLLAPERRTLLQAALTRRATEARAYLHAEGVRAGEPIALVDTGWFGTIQRSLEHILGAPLTGFYLGLLPPGDRPTAGEALGFTNHFAPLPLQREESHKVLIELLAQSDHGPALGFVQVECVAPNALPLPAVQIGEVGPVNLAEVRLLQDAVLTFTRRALAVENETSVPEAERARAVIEIYRGLHDAPTAREARVLGFTPHSDQYFEQRHASLCAELTPRETFAALADHRKRPPHWWIGGQAALGNAGPLRAFRFLKKCWWKLAGRAE